MDTWPAGRDGIVNYYLTCWSWGSKCRTINLIPANTCESGTIFHFLISFCWPYIMYWSFVISMTKCHLLLLFRAASLRPRFDRFKTRLIFFMQFSSCWMIHLVIENCPPIGQEKIIIYNVYFWFWENIPLAL